MNKINEKIKRNTSVCVYVYICIRDKQKKEALKKMEKFEVTYQIGTTGDCGITETPNGNYEQKQCWIKEIQ